MLSGASLRKRDGSDPEPFHRALHDQIIHRRKSPQKSIAVLRRRCVRSARRDAYASVAATLLRTGITTTGKPKERTGPLQGGGSDRSFFLKPVHAETRCVDQVSW